jgi:hypothetical protein
MDRQTRQRVAFLALVAFVAVGAWWMAPKVPRDLQLAFEVPPILRAEPLSVPREQIVRLDAEIRDGQGRQAARVSQDFGAGLASPITPFVPLSLAAADYAIEVRLGTAAGRQVRRLARLVVTESGAVRVPLE